MFLDATEKTNLYNKIPLEYLNTFGLNIDEDNKFFQTVFLQDEEPCLQSTLINAEILPDGKMKGSAEINSYGYHKINLLAKYNDLGNDGYLKIFIE